jgi:replicative superfamily II helicase
MKIQNQDGKTSFNLKKFKIIYIAPMKALVSEVVGNF